MSEQDSPSPRYRRPRQSPSVRLGKRLRDPINARLARYSLVPREPFVDPASIDGLGEIARHWRVIQEELHHLIAEHEPIPDFGEISPDHRRIAPGSQWKSFFFTGYGYRSEENCARCPRTWELLEGVQGLVVALFSIMKPGTDVPLHRGLTKAWLNCHLGLSIPAGPDLCGMEVAGQTVGWREGEWLVFDETNPHRVWNHADAPRSLLFLQVRRPMRVPGRLAGDLIYRLVRRSSFVQDLRKNIGAR